MVMGELVQETDVLVVGSGPGGYAAAFRAADLGLDVTMVDPNPRPGGVCLHKGCIPSKTFLYLAQVIHDADRAKDMGIRFGQPRIDIKMLREWKQKVIDRMADGLVSLSNNRSVQLIKGHARFESSDTAHLSDSEISRIQFQHAIIASGSHPTPFPGVPFQKGGRIMSSTGALALDDIPESLLVVGGGYVGLELGTVYAALGSRVSLVELAKRVLPDIDPDLAAPLQRRLQAIFDRLIFDTKISRMEENQTGVAVTYEQSGKTHQAKFDRVLVGIGRDPNSKDLGLENTGVSMDEKGFVVVDNQQRTADERIFAVGDVAGGYMLAHKAVREGKVAAEVIAGEPSQFDVRAIPAVIYTDPQIAWCGMMETDARREQKAVIVKKFPWKFSGRATTMGATDGLTKIIADAETQRVLGFGITGRETEGLIAEGVLAIEMGALAEDIALSMHAHPTLSETEGEAAEMFLDSATHILTRTAG